MKVLIFGSTGLVGSSVVKRLQNSINPLDVFASSRKDTNLFSSSETVKKVKEEFNPEGGAYGLGRTHGHKH